MLAVSAKVRRHNARCLVSALMVSALVPRSSGPGSSPGQGRCVVFLGKTLNSQCVSPPGTGKCLGKTNKLRRSDLRRTSIPSRGTSRFML